jgi:hypothetical protein
VSAFSNKSGADDDLKIRLKYLPFIYQRGGGYEIDSFFGVKADMSERKK